MVEDLGEELEAQLSHENLEHAFHEAADRVTAAAASGSLPKPQLLELYGLYKQATSGPCTSFRPPFFDVKARSKWAAWKNLDDMPANIAKLQYITSVESLLPQSTARGKKPEKGSTGGPVVSYMAETLEDKDAPGWDSLQIRASKGDSAAVLNLLDNGASVDERDTEGCAALHWAADRGWTEVVDLLLSRGADPNVRDSDGQTPLHYAALCGHKQIIEHLLQAAADPQATDIAGKKPSDVASPSITGSLQA